MAFQVKAFVSIVASMINRMRVTTNLLSDYNVGSVNRTMLEAVAQEIDQLYQQMINGLVEAIPTSVYTSFSFGLLPAQSASGLVRVTVLAPTAPLTIAAGDTFTPQNSSASFTSQSDATIAAGQTFVDVNVVAAVSGPGGNIPANTNFTLGQVPAGFVSAVNLAAFSNGTNQETPAQRQSRFNQFISTLPRGTPAALRYALLQLTFLTDSAGNTTEKVAFAAVDEPYTRDVTQPVGLVNCYIHNGVGSTSGNLVTQGQQIVNGYYNAAGQPVPGYKAAGVNTTVYAAPEQAVPIAGVVTAAPGYQASVLTPLVQTALESYRLGLALGQPCVLAQLYALAMAIPGVADFVISSPTADVACVAAGSVPATCIKIMPGADAIT